MAEVSEFLSNLFGTESWPARWYCGRWTGFHGWLYILSDAATGLAYFAIPVILLSYKAKKNKILFKNLFVLFSLFIFACGTTHIIDAIIFWQPVYRFSAAARFVTAGVSWLTVIALIKIAPQAMSLKTANELQIEVDHRKQSEDELKMLKKELEERINKRTHELHESNEKLKKEIEERKLYAEKLKEREEQFRSVIEASPNAIVVVDSKGHIVLVNRQTEQMFGYQRDELAGHTVENLIPENYRDGHVSYRQGYYENPQSRPMGAERNLYARHKSGKHIPVEIGLSPVKTGDETLVISSVVDITERKNIENELIEKNKQLEDSHAKLQNRTSQLVQSEKMSALGVLIAGVAHELNNPITGILNYAQYCQKHSVDNKKIYGVLDDLIEETKRCDSIVKNLLVYSRHTDTSDVEISKNPVEELNRVIQILQYHLREIDFENNVSGKLPACAIDKYKLQQIFMNLLQNAIDAIESGNTKKISIGFKKLEEFLEFEFKDTGIGIPPENIDKIFDPFFTTKEVGKGTGLGLSITRSIIDDCGGDIDITSELNKGTIIKLKLPLNNND